MNKVTKAVTAKLVFSSNLTTLATKAIMAEGKAESAKIDFYNLAITENILPSQIEKYADAFNAASLATFSAKVQEAIQSKLLQQKDIVKGVKSSTGLQLTKLEWMNQKNMRARRLKKGYVAYVEAKYIEKDKKLVLRNAGATEEKGAGTRKRPVAVLAMESLYKQQQKFANIETPKTWEYEANKMLRQLIDYIKANDKAALAAFNKLNNVLKPKKQITAKGKQTRRK